MSHSHSSRIFGNLGQHPGPLFMDSRQQLLAKANFIARIKGILGKVGFLSEHFAGHSFRNGTATAAAQARIEDSMIQALGW